LNAKLLEKVAMDGNGRCVKRTKIMNKQRKRTMQEVMDSLLLPFAGLCGNPETEVRVRAVANVLQRIPEKAYHALCEKVDEFVWFTPGTNPEAMVQEFPCTMPETNDFVARTKILYLSPSLEFRDPMFVVAVVAHELAHVLLIHNAGANTEANYQNQEREAWRTMAAWGFENEKRAYKKVREKEDREEAREIAKAKRAYAKQQ
jgi:hypothetical protein